MNNNVTIINGEAKSNYLSLSIKNYVLGKVHSKFKTGFNVEFDHSLIFISFAGAPLSVFGLNIKEEKLREILDSARIGDVVVNKKGNLIFYCLDEIVSVNYKDLEEIDLRLPQINCSISKLPDTKLYNYLANIDFNELIGIELNDRTNEYVNLLLYSNKDSIDTNSRIVGFFSGRGRGLTPSGDDILTGFTLSLMIYGEFISWKQALKAGVNNQTTTIISEAYLKALLEGYASEYFIELIKLVDTDDLGKIKEIIKKVQTFGHTSGNDTLFGFFLGLKYLINY